MISLTHQATITTRLQADRRPLEIRIDSQSVMARCVELQADPDFWTKPLEGWEQDVFSQIHLELHAREEPVRFQKVKAHTESADEESPLDAQDRVGNDHADYGAKSGAARQGFDAASFEKIYRRRVFAGRDTER